MKKPPSKGGFFVAHRRGHHRTALGYPQTAEASKECLRTISIATSSACS